jgi:type III pantothenate kinase
MPDIAIDAGNTAIKAAVFKSDGRPEIKSNLKEFDLITLVNSFPDSKVIVASVGSVLVNFINLVVNKERVHFLDESLRLPIENGYETPATLGSDRLAAVCGAWEKFPNKNILVIDVGTCITYDLINNNGIYLGGMISPGLNLRFKSLNEHTSRLPLLLKSDQLPNILGADTEHSIRSGVQNGILFEINGAIDAFSAKYSDLQVLLCGGDGAIFESKINHTIFADPNLVLSGLHAILSFNYP